MRSSWASYFLVCFPCKHVAVSVNKVRICEATSPHPVLLTTTAAWKATPQGGGQGKSIVSTRFWKSGVFFPLCWWGQQDQQTWNRDRMGSYVITTFTLCVSSPHGMPKMQTYDNSSWEHLFNVHRLESKTISTSPKEVNQKCARTNPSIPAFQSQLINFLEFWTWNSKHRYC